MALTPEQIIEARKRLGIPEGGIASSTDPALSAAAANVARRRQLAAEYDAKQQQEKGFFERAGESLVKRGQEIKKTFGQTARGEISPLETGVRVIGDAIGAAGDVVGEAVSPAIQPVIEKIVETDLGKQAFSVMSQGVEKFNEWKMSSPENQRMGEFLEGFGNIASILPVTKAGQLTKKAASQTLEAGMKATKKGGDMAIKAAQPITKGTKNVGEYIISQTTGMTPETIETIIKNPEQFTKAQREGLQRVTLANKVQGALDKRIDDLGSLGKEYQTIRESGQQAILPGGGYKKFLEDKYKISIDDTGKVTRTKASSPMSKQDISAIEEFMEVYGKENTFSADEFLNVRQQLDNIARFDTGKTDASKKIARDLRHFHDTAGKEQIEGLADLDARYAPEAEMLNKLRSEFFDKDGTLKDTAINRIANVTGKGKDLQLERLKELIPDIEEQVKILKALEDIEYTSGRTVGAYMRGGLGAVGIATGSPLAILGAIAATPKVIVPILTKFGTPLLKSREKILEIIEKIQQGRKLSTQEKGIVRKAIEAASAAIGSGGMAGAIDQIKETEL